MAQRFILGRHHTCKGCTLPPRDIELEIQFGSLSDIGARSLGGSVDTSYRNVGTGSEVDKEA